MPNVNGNFDLRDETPEADAIDQHVSVDAEDDGGLDTFHLGSVSDRDVDEADLIDQATMVPVEDF